MQVAYSAPMTEGHWRARFRLGALAAVAFVLAHDLVFLLTDTGSYGLALTRTGHGEQWTGTVILVAALALALAVLGAIRLISLSRLAGELDAGDITVRAGAIRDLAGHLVRAWLTILPVALVLFVGVENVEHLSVGLPAPGLSVLGSSQYHSVFAVFALVSLLAALVDALYQWRRDLLVARIEAARDRLRHRAALVARQDLPWVDRRHASIIGNGLFVRAPPQRALA
jgi:HAMP domain-containing protein